MSKKTPWFPHDVKPIRVGVYQRAMQSGLPGYSRWTGEHWCWTQLTVDGARVVRGASLLKRKWRGLAEDPSK